MKMREWKRRPSDVAALFNPAYCAALLSRVAAGYQSATNEGLPYALAFIALPLILHPGSVTLLPKSASSRFHTWLLKNPEIIFGFDQRARSISPFTREAITFGIQNKIIAYATNARITPIESKNITKWQKFPENELPCKKALLLGKLLSQIKDVPTTFSLFGVRP